MRGASYEMISQNCLINLMAILHASFMNDFIKPESQDITAYLLGQASAAEAERLDELSITHDEFADALEAAEMDLIDLYVNGELSPGDREKFEQKYTRSVDHRDRVVFAKALQEYASSGLSARPVIANGGRWFGWTGRVFRFGLAAAALLLAVVGGWYFILKPAQSITETAAVHDDPVDLPIPTNTAGTTPIELASNGVREKEKERSDGPPTVKIPIARPPRMVAVILSPQTRSSGAPRKVEVPAGTDHLSIRLELESGDFQSYRAVLSQRSSNLVIWQMTSIKPAGPADEPRLAVSIPARLLNSADYTFTVSGLSEKGTAEIVGDYSFTVVR